MEVILEKTRLRAPCNGKILEINGELGEITNSKDMEPSTIMIDDENLYVRAYVEELDVLSIKIGQRIWATGDQNPNRKYYGVIIFCSPHLTQKTEFNNHPNEKTDVKVREIKIKMDKEDNDNLLIGLPLDVYIIVD